jgi:hypothetical protein
MIGLRRSDNRDEPIRISASGSPANLMAIANQTGPQTDAGGRVIERNGYQPSFGAAVVSGALLFFALLL